MIEGAGHVPRSSAQVTLHLDVALLSATEGDDKPAKYPVMFRAADAMVISKTDLLPYLDDFDPGRARDRLRALANPAPVFELSARSGEGLDAWCDWLRAGLSQRAGGGIPDGAAAGGSGPKAP